ncbi:MAG: carbohydrate ABC transporter permease [Clostridia bacterium]
MKTKCNIYDVMVVLVCGIILLVTIYPLWFIVIASISEPSLVSTGQVTLYPRQITWLGYEKVLAEHRIWRGYGNSIVYTALYTALGLTLILPAAFAFSSRPTMLGKPLTFLFMFTMFFGGGLIPTYLLISKLGMNNTLWALVIPGSVSVYNMIVARTFFKTSIPQEIQESATIDGCNDFMVFFMIVLPLSKAIVAVLALYYAVAMWNSYFGALIYISSPEKYPLQLVLREILFRSEQLSTVVDGDPVSMQELYRTTELVKYVLMIVASVPMFIAYPFVQKFFVTGVMIGSVKG